jgi:hypothetical protein
MEVLQLKVAGKVNIPPISIDGERITDEPTRVEFEVVCEVKDLKGVLEVVREIPDAVADTYRKVMGYEKEFCPETAEEQDTSKEVA